MPEAQAQAVPDDHRPREGRYQPLYQLRSRAAAPRPLILMADFAQGLDASKLILAETVRLSNSCGICGGFTPAHTRTFI